MEGEQGTRPKLGAGVPVYIFPGSHRVRLAVREYGDESFTDGAQLHQLGDAVEDSVPAAEAQELAHGACLLGLVRH